jgi:hypothetical protein
MVGAEEHGKTGIRTSVQTRRYDRAIARSSTVQPGLATSVCAPDDAPAKRNCQSGHGQKTCCSVVLDVAKQLAIFAVGGIRFERGKARARPWREVGRRPNDWASRSLKGEFELSNHGRSFDRRDGWVKPLDYERAVVVDAEGSKKTNKTTLGGAWRGVRKSVQKEKKKGLDGVSIVRDGREPDLPRVSDALNGVLHLREFTNDSSGGIENDVVKKCSRGWVPS